MVREPILTTVDIADLRPTQITVGMREVTVKRKHWREIGRKKGGEIPRQAHDPGDPRAEEAHTTSSIIITSRWRCMTRGSRTSR